MRQLHKQVTVLWALHCISCDRGKHQIWQAQQRCQCLLKSMSSRALLDRPLCSSSDGVAQRSLVWGHASPDSRSQWAGELLL